MKYFIDFEFLEGDIPCQIKGFNIPKWIIKPNNTIQPISVGIVAEDGREYYAISKDFNLKEAWNRYEWKKHNSTHKEDENKNLQQKVYWIRENVLKPILVELKTKEYIESNKSLYHGAASIYIHSQITSSFIQEYNKSINNKLLYKEFKNLINKYSKTNKQIAEEIKEFIGTKETIGNWDNIKNKMNAQFYGYYSDYDWVVFCWLFGKMIDLPNGFPMYCIDLKQELDRIQDNANKLKEAQISYKYNGELKKHPNYPKQTNEHNALQDAHFNYNLYKFLQTV